MRETALDTMFAEFQADAVPTFRPPGVADAQRRARRRRRRRQSSLATLLALAVAAPAAGFAVAGRDGDQPAPAVIERKVALPGVAGRLADLSFVDQRHGWALFDTCQPETASGCHRTVGRTVDGGLSWQGRELPVTDGEADLTAVDELTVVVTAGREYLLTTDGGETFSRHAVDAPPMALQLVDATASGFRLACPAEQEARGEACNRFHLARVGSAPVPRQPPLDLDPARTTNLVEGGDGRLWLAVTKYGRTDVVVSDDRAQTWRKLPPLRVRAYLTVSPDGAEAWLVGTDHGDPVWRLVDDRWEQRPGPPRKPDPGEFAAAGDGTIFLSSLGTVGFWVDGQYVDRPELRVAFAREPGLVNVRVLRDGTLALSTTGSSRILGIGSGMDRDWIRFS